MIEQKLVEVLAPLADELNALKSQVASIQVKDGADGKDGRDGKDADPVEVDIEEVAQVIKADADFLSIIKGERGDPGESIVGERGLPGVDGLGIETKAWEKDAVYREGAYVTHALGKIYKAIKDTASKPGSQDWVRVGSAGFEWKGLKQADAVYENGDLYIDGGSTFIWWDGKGSMFTQRGARGSQGEKGLDGVDGKDAPYPVVIKADMTGFHVAMSDGEVHSAEIDGLADVVKEYSKGAVLYFIDQLYADIEQEGGTPLRAFKGTYMVGGSYSTGDVVTFNKSVWVATKATSLDYFDDQIWRRMFSMGGGGGGGGGGGITRTTQILADGLLNMGNFGIAGLANPRSGAGGALDAVNQQTVDQKIAAGSLYQGTYKPAIGLPNIPQLANTNFVAPVGGDEINKPVGAPGVTTPGDLDVWFNLKGKGLDNFAATLAAPLQLDVTFSDGTHHSFLLPAGAYADAAAVERALNTLATGTSVVAFHGNVNGSDFWLGVETSYPLYATSIVGQAGGGFPLFTPGATSTVLNTYNWVVSTTDPNVPEYMPPGLPGISAGTKVNNSDLLQFNANTKQFEIIRGGNLTQNFADQRYWQLQAGNMAWVDQPYNKGAVVYGTRFNAWFTATQNIVLGSAEPGTTAAGAIWRKINSTYGSTIFFGRGDYNTTHTDAAHNWGMPAGTYPAGQQPLNGDSYYDINTGSEVQFTVNQNAPLFTLSGTVGDAHHQQGADLGNADLANFPGTRTALALPAYWKIVLGASQTPTTGAFAGKTFPAGTYLIGFSGDPDADNGGWFIVLDTVGSQSNWTVNTPHPQSVPDTITPKIVWGFKRKFNITIGASVADNTEIKLLEGIPEANAATHIEIRRTDANGSTYEFDVLTVISGQANLSPIAVKAQDSKFKKILVNWEAGRHFEIGAIVNANAHGTSYQITVTTYDYDISLVTVGNGVATMGGTTDSFKADTNYPGVALGNFLKAQAGDASATSVGAPGSNIAGTWQNCNLDRKYVFDITSKPAADKSIASLGIQKKGGGDVNWTTATIICDMIFNVEPTGATPYIGSGGGIQHIFDNGDIWGSEFAIPAGKRGKIKIEIDNRDPDFQLVTLELWGISWNTSKFGYCIKIFELPTAQRIEKIKLNQLAANLDYRMYLGN